MSTPRKSLGRGLGSLIAGGTTKTANANKNTAPTTPAATTAAPTPAAAEKTATTTQQPATAAATVSPFQEIPVHKIVPARWQARREIEAQSLDQLAESIQAEGLLQPIVVRKTADGYELIAGERRWRAFQKLSLKNIPARILNVSDAATAVLTLIENLQRENLNPIDEALGFASLMRDFNLTQENVAERVGKPRATIANSVRLLSLDRDIQGFLAKGMLSTGHAKAILGLDTAEDRLLAARRIVETSASVREAEALVKKIKDGKLAPRGATAPANTRLAAEVTAEIGNIEKHLTTRLNTKVHLKHGEHRGKIIIEYFGNDDLRRILEKIGTTETTAQK